MGLLQAWQEGGSEELVAAGVTVPGQGKEGTTNVTTYRHTHGHAPNTWGVTRTLPHQPDLAVTVSTDGYPGGIGGVHHATPTTRGGLLPTGLSHALHWCATQIGQGRGLGQFWGRSWSKCWSRACGSRGLGGCRFWH